MGRYDNEFIVDTNGCCFLCLKKSETDPITQLELNQNISTYSLLCLSQYLNMDLRKVFKEKYSIPPSLLTRVERSRLKVELCHGCGSITEKFAGLYRQLEKLKMEMTDCLRLVHGKLINAGSTGETKPFEVSSVNDDPNFNSMEKAIGKLEVANMLRTEAIEKCQHKINLDAPRVKVQRLRKIKTQLNPDAINVGVNLTQHNMDTSTESKPNDAILSSPEIKVEYCNSPPEQTLDENDDEAEAYHSNDLYPNWELPESDEEERSHQGFLRHDDPDMDVVLKPGRRRGRTSPASSKSRKGASNVSIFNPNTGRHKCRRCSKEFTASTNIYAHFKSAHLKVRYKCTVLGCGKEFTQLHSYKRHQMSVHMGTRFPCKTCSRTFTNKSYLRAHQQIEHDGRRLPCKFCNLTFKSFGGRKQHLRMYHRNK